MWAHEEFNESLKGKIHGRSRKSLSIACDLILRNSGLSFFSALGPSLRQDIAAILAKKNMNSDLIQHGHRHATLQRINSLSGELVIVAQDTSYFNYTSHPAMKGLKPFQGANKGLLMHSMMALDHTGLPLGLVGQHIWVRKGHNADLFNLESDKWPYGLHKVKQLAEQSSKTFLLVQDREADIFSFFKADRPANVQLLVRVHEPRRMMRPGRDDIIHLPDLWPTMPVVGHKEVTLQRNRKYVRIRLEVREELVHICPDKNLSAAKYKTGPMRLISAKEIDAWDEKGNGCFNEKEAAHWLLMTTLPQSEQYNALGIVGYYGLRWRIEMFHFTMKTGALKVEKLQFDDVQTMINALSMYSIIAWQLLFLTYAARDQPQLPAGQCFDETEVLVLEKSTASKVATINEAVKALGKLVAFQPTKRQQLPGIMKLGQALVKLHYMTLGFRLAENFSLQD